MKRQKLTANRAADVGVQVVALEKSNFSASFYLRFGIKLQNGERFVKEPECDIRTTVEGPWGGQPAFEVEAGPTEEDVVRLLDAHVLPLLEQTSTRSRLEELPEKGGLANAFVLKDARRDLGWEDQ